MATTTSYAGGRLRPARWWGVRLSLVVRDHGWLLWTTLLSALLVAQAGRNLGNFPGISSDDAWIMSASHKLASEGTFGSDMFRGFANAESHYFIALPVYHLLQAGLFAAFGTSVAVARVVTLGSAVVALWCVAWLARRWFGPGAAVLATGLLLIWPDDLLRLSSRLSFLAVSRTGRYDMTGLALLLLALVALEIARSSERRLSFFLCGLTGGLAVQTQFFGAFAVPLFVVALLAGRGRGGISASAVRWLTAGWLLVVAPYALYVLAHWADFKGQSELKTGRIEFGDPGFYLDNVADELDRYLPLFDHLSLALDGRYDRLNAPLAPAIFGVFALLALAYLTTRLARDPTPGERQLALSIGVFALCLMALDGTNAPLYALPLLPLLCIAIAAFVARAIERGMRPGPLALRLAALALVLVPLGVVAREGGAAHRQERHWSRIIVDYDAAAGQIDGLLPAGEPVAGIERWWAGLHEGHDYLSLTAVTLQLDATTGSWTAADLDALLRRYGIAAMIIDGDARGLLSRLPPGQREVFNDYIRDYTRHAGTLDIHPYGQIDVYVVASAAPGP